MRLVDPTKPNADHNPGILCKPTSAGTELTEVVPIKEKLSSAS